MRSNPGATNDSPYSSPWEVATKQTRIPRAPKKLRNNSFPRPVYSNPSSSKLIRLQRYCRRRVLPQNRYPPRVNMPRRTFTIKSRKRSLPTTWQSKRFVSLFPQKSTGCMMLYSSDVSHDVGHNASCDSYRQEGKIIYSGRTGFCFLFTGRDARQALRINFTLHGTAVDLQPASGFFVTAGLRVHQRAVAT